MAGNTVTDAADGPHPEPGVPNRDAGPRRRLALPPEWRPRIVIAALIIGVAASLIAAAIWTNLTAPKPTVEATFDRPERGDVVGHKVVATARLSAPADGPLWLVTEDQEGRYHPADRPCLVRQLRVDCNIAYVGPDQPINEPQDWRLLLAIADDAAHESLKQLAIKQQEDPDYTGEADLRPGLTVIGDVGITRGPAV